MIFLSKMKKDTVKILPILEKRAACVYFYNLTNISAVLEELFDLLDQKTIRENDIKLSQEESEIVGEVAAYFYFVTVNRIWGTYKWNLSKKDAYALLDYVAEQMFNALPIGNLNEKLKEYGGVAERGAKSPLGHLSESIVKILRKDNKERLKPMQIQTVIRDQLTNYFLISLKQTSKLSETEMDLIIQDFRLNFSHLIKI